jgi:hypothetical protein
VESRRILARDTGDGTERDFMKTLRFLAAAMLGVTLIAATPQSKDAKPSWADWNAWNGFPEGAWVTIDREMRGRHLWTTLYTLTKKTPDRLTVTSTSLDKKKEGDDQPVLELPAIPGLPETNGDEIYYVKNPKPFPCPTCRAEHKPSIITEQKKEKLKIADKEVLCYVIDVVPFDCKGVKDGNSRWWMSKEVPGGLVKREFTAEGRPGKVVDTVLDFDKKKKVESEGK